MRLSISHQTSYHFDQPVLSGLQELRLTPKTFAGQRVLHWETEVDGGVKQLEFNDQHMNRVELISFAVGQSVLEIRSTGEVETSDTSGVTAGHNGFVPLWLFLRTTELTRARAGVRRLIDGLDRTAGTSDVDLMHELSSRVAGAVTYESGRTHVGSTAEEALAAGHGVCQDHAHVFISAARQLGIPARYVSGYLMMTDRVDQDASHGWAEVWIEALGWVGFDVSNGICPDERYVRVATGLDYREAAPISGLRFGSGDERLTVSVQVQQ